MLKKNYLISIFTVTSIALQTSCNKKNDNSKDENDLAVKNSLLKNTNFQLENNTDDKLIFIETPYEDLENEFDKIKYLEETYKNYNVKITKVPENQDKKENERTKEFWRLTATFYPKPSKIEFKSLKELNSALQDQVFQDYKNNFTKYGNFEEKYQVVIKPLIDHKNYKFELSANWLDNKFYFEDFQSLKNTVINGYLLERENNLTSAFRILRGKSEFSVKRIAPLNSGGAMVLDGFDDTANALENTNISDRLKSFIQCTLFYPSFIFFVESGADGAAHQYKELKSELYNLLLEEYTQELKIKETITDLINKKTEIF